MKDGRTVIPYEHFSVVLHKERKLAIFTATNVDGSPKARRPEAGKNYTRDALTGLKSSDLEKWVLDSRVDAQFQSPTASIPRITALSTKAIFAAAKMSASVLATRRCNAPTAILIM
jgi:hypothetical protein